MIDSTYSKRLISLLLHCKLITKNQLESINQDKSLANKNLLEYLINHKIIDSENFMQESANLLRLAYMDLNALNIELIPQDFFDNDICKENNYLPLFIKNEIVHIAIANPINSQELLKNLRNKYACSFVVVIGELNLLKEKIQEFNQYLQDERQSTNSSNIDNIHDTIDLDFIDDFEHQNNDLIGENEENDAPIIRFINNTIFDAIQKNASDIHFEPYEKTFRIRYRIDGILVQMFSTGKNLAPKVVSRLKIMANLDIAEKRIPQDGKFKISFSNEKIIDFRVSTCPINFGEKVVLRIIDSSTTQISIEALGFSEKQKQIYLDKIQQSQGMILVTGPTGSGKTVTLYSGLNILNKPEKNISTAEDPAEISVKGINQVSINNKQGLTFAEALRAFLRQDPDIIMIGEIRDLETGSIAIKASQTGHLVMSTLHTNSAPETLNRLVDMGLPKYNIATSVSLIIAQRLARKLCPKCRLKDTKTDFSLLIDKSGLDDNILKNFDTTLEKIKKADIYKANPKGCSRCFNGYKGRQGLYEVMPISNEIAKIILEDKNTIDIANQAQQEGVATVRQSAFVKVAEGIISMEELFRVSS